MGSKNYDFTEEIKLQIEESIAVKEKVIQENVDVINQVAELIINTFQYEKKVKWSGNGGSAADSQHLACEFVSKFYLNRKALRSIALTTNTSILTAVSNDFTFDDVFKRQVEALGGKGDVLIGITTSGTSTNIINAFKTANEKGITTVSLTGEFIDALVDISDYMISIPSDITPHIQESHIMVGHIICYLVENTLFGDKTWKTKQYSSIETVP